MKRKKPQKQSDLLGRTIENLLEGCQLIDDEWRYTYLNKAALRHARKTEDELIGRTMMECYPGIETTEMFQTLQRSVEDGSPRTIENQFVYPDGSSAWFELHVEPFSGGLILLSFDITKRKQAELSKRAVLEQFTHIAENTPGVISMFRRRFDGAYDFPYASQGLRTIFGVSPKEVEASAEPIFRLVHSEDVERVRSSLEESGKNLTLWNETFRIVPVLGTPKWVEGRGSPRSMKDGSIVWYGHLADVTERKEAEQRTLRLQRLESVGALAGGIVHDMNNILGPIMMALGNLRRKLVDPSDRKMLELLESNSKRAASLVRQILTFARGSELHKSPLSAQAIVQEVVSMAKPTFPANISFDVDMPDNLWTILGDVTQVHQVLLNLCVNARDAMPDGGTITFHAENVDIDDKYYRMNPEARPGRYVMLRVADTGIGMDEETAGKIFDPFFTTKQVGKGTGLGLSTVSSIVKGHGGFLSVQSKPGRGTEFRIRFPASRLAMGEDLATEDVKTPLGHGELIMVVDDDAVIRDIAKISLESGGYSVIVASDGTMAVGLYAKHQERVKIVITDIDMPYMSGPALTRALHSLNPEILVIGSSGTANTARLEEAEASGMKGLLVKPYTAETLLRKIDEVLRGSGLENI